jgi:hypothetical protein
MGGSNKNYFERITIMKVFNGNERVIVQQANDHVTIEIKGLPQLPMQCSQDFVDIREAFREYVHKHSISDEEAANYSIAIKDFASCRSFFNALDCAYIYYLSAQEVAELDTEIEEVSREIQCREAKISNFYVRALLLQAIKSKGGEIDEIALRDTMNSMLENFFESSNNFDNAEYVALHKHYEKSLEDLSEIQKVCVEKLRLAQESFAECMVEIANKNTEEWLNESKEADHE